MKEITSNDIKRALARRHGDREFFMTECKTGPTQTGLLIFDGLAIYKSWSHPRIVGYEIKVSRSDFLSDAKYSRYLPYCHEFYFVTPAHLVERYEVEDNIGLMWYNPETGSLATKKKAVWRDIEISGAMLLYVIMNRLESDRLPFHSTQAEYWKDWLDNKISNRELGYRVRSKLLSQIRELEDKDRDKRYADVQRKYNEVLNVMCKHGLSVWYDASKILDEALARKYPAEFDAIRAALSNAISQIDKLREVKGE